jgi:mannose-6-phosphate isomerase
MEPVRVDPVPVRRSYRGGAALAAFHGRDAPDGDRPEEWLGSTTASSKPERDGVGAGLCRLPDGRLLADAIAADPEPWLGAAHVERFGPDPRVLVKLLDAGERLTVQAHPGDDLARAALGAAFGKSEAWLVLGTREPGPLVHVGFREDRSRADLLELVRRQDVPALLAALNAVPARAGDVHHVPAGVVHAVGAGVLLLELEEPSDLTFHLEWRGRVDERRAHLGLGWERTVAALEVAARDPAPGLPPAARRSFWVDTVPDAPGRFAALLVTAGEGAVNGQPARRGDVFLLPAALRELRVDGGLRVARCLGPDPAA